MFEHTVYHDAIEELALSGAVALPRNYSESSYRRYAREINKILEKEKANWRCVAKPKERSLEAVNI